MIRNLRRRIGSGLNYALWLIATIALYGMALERDVIDNFLVALAVISALQFSAILIHEMGHALAAHWAGARVEKIVVVPLHFDIQKRRLRFDRYLPAGDIGGFVTYTFGRVKPAAHKVIIIAAAGPLANVFSAALLFLTISAAGWINEERGPATSHQPVAIVGDNHTPSQAANRVRYQLTSPRPYPSEEEIEQAVVKEKEWRSRKYYRDWGAALADLFIAISLILGALNLIPTKGSDGASILSNWRRLRSQKRP